MPSPAVPAVAVAAAAGAAAAWAATPGTATASAAAAAATKDAGETITTGVVVTAKHCYGCGSWSSCVLHKHVRLLQYTIFRSVMQGHVRAAVL